MFPNRPFKFSHRVVQIGNDRNSGRVFIYHGRSMIPLKLRGFHRGGTLVYEKLVKTFQSALGLLNQRNNGTFIMIVTRSQIFICSAALSANTVSALRDLQPGEPVHCLLNCFKQRNGLGGGIRYGFAENADSAVVEVRLFILKPSALGRGCKVFALGLR